jgi:hypothetical protein
MSRKIELNQFALNIYGIYSIIYAIILRSLVIKPLSGFQRQGAYLFGIFRYSLVLYIREDSMRRLYRG